MFVSYVKGSEKIPITFSLDALFKHDMEQNWKSKFHKDVTYLCFSAVVYLICKEKNCKLNNHAAEVHDLVIKEILPCICSAVDSCRNYKPSKFNQEPSFINICESFLHCAQVILTGSGAMKVSPCSRIILTSFGATTSPAALSSPNINDLKLLLIALLYFTFGSNVLGIYIIHGATALLRLAILYSLL